MIHFSKYQLIILIFVTFISLTGCESEAEKEARYQKEKDACLAREESRCNSACEASFSNTWGESREKKISNCKFQACVLAPFEEVEHCYR